MGKWGSRFQSCTIPDQWKVSKIIPVFKKGSKCEIENYRPIANLCSASKILERLILKQIHYLESKNNLDLTGKQQHGFKKNKSTATAGALLQSIIARAADNITIAKGHEPMLYEAQLVIAGPFFKFTFVKMKRTQ